MKLKWIIVVLCGLAMAVFLYLFFRKSADFEPLIKDKLMQLVAKASDGLYILKVDRIEIDVLHSSVTAVNVSLTPDSARMLVLDSNYLLPNDIFSGTLNSLLITGISAKDFIGAKDIILTEIFMDNPDITITHKKRNYNRPDTGNFYSRIAPGNESYALKMLSLQNIRLTHINLDKKNQVSRLKNLTALFMDIKIDSSTVRDSTRFLFANEAEMVLKNYSTTTADKRYNFTIDSIALNPRQGTMHAKNIRFKPIGSKADFSAKTKFMQDRFDILFKESRFININWWSLIGNEAMLADSLHIKGGFINVYNDRSLPSAGKSKVGNYPHQLLKKIDFPVNMKFMSLRNIDVSYEEFNPASGKSGKVDFNQTDGEIRNITNMPEQIAIAGGMSVHAKTKFMNEAALDVVFNFNLAHAGKGVFSVDATMGPMDGKNLNSATEGLALVKVEDLRLDKLKAHITGSDTKANGTVLFAYRDLKITALKNDKEEPGKLKKKGLVTSIANTFIISKANPSEGKPERQYAVAQQRDTERSFFNLIWQCIKQGIIETVKGK